MKLNMIAAIGKNNELGKNNNLIWHLKEDLKFFKDITIGKTIVMGENTYFSLPKMLPNRKHIVLSLSDKTFPDEVKVYHDYKEFLSDYQNIDEDIFVIGGGSIYKLFINYVNNIYLTEINATCPSADVYFPNFDKSLYDKEILSNHIDNEIKYKHVIYKRRR